MIRIVKSVPLFIVEVFKLIILVLVEYNTFVFLSKPYL